MEPETITPLWEVIDSLADRLRMDIAEHTDADDVFRNRRYDEACQYLAKASKLLKGE